ncbi:YbfB/YjiJ family MFS transporter [Nocardia sp. NPDC004568]|uniref:YbfB/YjiJ family MFS transporter n=1 Tax=Nocardia sp. NPDC004568 TaxID=3154551 RepID=UPI0033B424B1
MPDVVDGAPRRIRIRARTPSTGRRGSADPPAPATPGPVLRQAVCLAFGTASALGFARFAYGLLLPVMRDDLGWNSAAAGMPATANGLGYLLGALATPPLARRFGTTWVFRGGTVLTAAALAATGAGGDQLVLLTLRAAAGVAGAAVFISGGVIASHLAVRAGSGTPITVYFAGTGLGVVLSGLGFPLTGDHWQLAWFGLGVAAAVAAGVSWPAGGEPGEAVLVGHSYGGMVITGAADRAPDRIAALVYVDAMVPAHGDSCWDLASEQEHRWYLDVVDTGDAVRPLPFFDPRATPHPLASVLQPLALGGGIAQIRSRTYVYAAGWDTPSPFTAVYARLSREPGWTTHSLDGGHNLMRDDPEGLLTILRASIEAR